MSNKVDLKEVDVNVTANDDVNSSYKEIINADQEQNRARAQALAILPEKAKQEIVAASKYSAYFPNPITKDFQKKYILADMEFPTLESKLAQSMTELNVRIDNLFNDAYMYKKSELEAQELDVEMQELELELEKADTDLKRKKISIQIQKKELDMQNKGYSLNKTKLAAMARYNEAMGWKGCVEDLMQDIGVTDISEVDFDQVRMGEMRAKIKKWGELHAQGSLELTPSKFNAIDSNQEAFVQGVQEGHQKIEEAKKILQLTNTSGNASKRN